MKVLHAQEVMNTRPALLGSKGVSTGVALRQRVQQCLRLLQVGGIKALGEPWIGKSKALLCGGRRYPSASRRLPRCTGGSRVSLIRVRWAGMAYAQRGATTATARTELPSPHASSANPNVQWWNRTLVGSTSVYPTPSVGMESAFFHATP